MLLKTFFLYRRGVEKMLSAKDKKKEREKEAFERGKEDAAKGVSYKEGACVYSHDDDLRYAYTRGFTQALRERQ